MNIESEKKMARWLLARHEYGCEKPNTYIRNNARRYYYLVALCGSILVVLALAKYWVGFGMLSSFLGGILYRDSELFKGMKTYLPFYLKVMDWEIVKKIAEAKPAGECPSKIEPPQTGDS